jgi:ribosome maturation factor RimP
MNTEQQIAAIKELINILLQENPQHFLVAVKLKQGNNIRVALDGDEGLAIDSCIKYNRTLYKKIEEAGWYPSGDFSLEVSSPGLDEPLKMHRQYIKNIGRMAAVVLMDETSKEGKLVAVTEHSIVLQEVKGKGKKQEIMEHTLLFDNIKSTKIQIVF